MHVVYNAEIFRRNPRLGIGLGVILLCIAAGGLATLYPEYKSLGKAPEALTVEQAVPSPDTVPDQTTRDLPQHARRERSQAASHSFLRTRQET